MLDAAFAAAVCAGWFLLAGTLIAAAGLADLVLFHTGHKTVSWYMWRRSGKLLDFLILAAQLAVVWIFLGFPWAVVFSLGAIGGHNRTQAQGGADQ